MDVGGGPAIRKAIHTKLRSSAATFGYSCGAAFAADEVPFTVSPPSGLEYNMLDTFSYLLDADLDPLFWPPSRLGVSSAWYDHVPFAHWLICNIQPRVVVELGTHNGVSYCAFCEAVARKQLPTACFAVDTWKGDEHAGFYGEEVYEDLARFNGARYGPFSELVRCTFDEALPYFADNSVDFLHIDGLHTYSNVKHDFESWLPKLSDRAVVLLHDTNVRERDFGVWRLFLELQRSWPTFEFLHGHGLGVIALGTHVPPIVSALCAMDQKAIYVVRQLFVSVASGWTHENASLKNGQAGFDSLAARVESLTAEVSSERSRYDSLAARVESLTAEVSSERSRSDGLAARVESLTAEASSERSRSDGLAARVGLFESQIPTFRRRFINWSRYDDAHGVWKQYKKNDFSKGEALNRIDVICGRRSFFILYPLYKIAKPFRKVTMFVARRILQMGEEARGARSIPLVRPPCAGHIAVTRGSTPAPEISYAGSQHPVGWQRYDSAYSVWKQYRRNYIDKNEALSKIDSVCGVKLFLLMYPLYKIVKPFRRLTKSLQKGKLPFITSDAIGPWSARQDILSERLLILTSYDFRFDIIQLWIFSMFRIWEI